MTASDVPVFFFCLGTTEKPRHDCTRETVSAVADALEGEPDTFAYAPVPGIVADDEARKRSPKTYKLKTLIDKIGDKKFRAQVKCERCATVSVLTDKLVREAKPSDLKADIDLILPSPGDLALIDAAKALLGIDALKASTANSTFVLGSLALITTLVTTLGLVKTEEIGKTLTAQDMAWLLILAALAGMAAIGCALYAQRVTTGEIHSSNLEEVRQLLKKEIAWRSDWSKRSLYLLGVAALIITSAFVWTVYKGGSKEPTGKLAVTLNPASLTAGLETSWSNAGNDTRLLLTVLGADNVPLLTNQADTQDGTAEIKTSVAVSRPPAASKAVVIKITSQLMKSDGQTPIEGASKSQCIEVQGTGTLATTKCEQ